MDRAAKIMSGLTVLLGSLTITAIALFVVFGHGYLGLAIVACQLLAACAVAGTVFAIVRGMRSGRATR